MAYTPIPIQWSERTGVVWKCKKPPTVRKEALKGTAERIAGGD